MQKTKLGISVGLLGAIVFFACLFGGYFISIILVGYILLAEENIWLRKTAVKAIILTFAFSILSAAISLIPGVVNVIASVIDIFGGDDFGTLTNSIVSVITGILHLIETVLFILLGGKALNQGTIKIPVLDSLVNKYMD